MALLPTEILTDEKLAEFISDVNANADKIVGDSKFKIPSPELPGTGMLIKLWIREAEKSFSAYLVPVLVVKEVLNKPLEIKDKINSISEFINNPLQALLDETVNPLINQDLFIPLELTFSGSPSADFSNLKSLVDRADSDTTSSPPAVTQTPFPYILGTTGSVPGNGEYTFTISQGNTIISISSRDYSGLNVSTFSSLIPGDQISISKDGISQSWIIKSIVQNSGYYSLSVTLKNKSIQQLEGQIVEETAYVEVLQNPDSSGKKALRALLVGPDGKIKFPIVIGLPQVLSLAGVDVSSSPLSKVAVKIGSFDSLPDSSPLKTKIKNLEAKAGWNFQKDVLQPMLNGEYPVIKWKPEDKKTEKDKAREELLALSKVFDILVNDTSLFFKILVNYLKLLLLPIQIVIGSLKSAFSSALEKPLEIFRIITLLITDPLKLLGDLIAKAILEQIKPYVEPALTAAKIDWNTEVVLVDEGGKEKGLQPLISDMIIGRFKCKDLNNPKGSDIVNVSPGVPAGGTAGGTGGGTNDIEFTKYSYFYKYDGTVPENGEVSLSSSDLDKVSSIKISVFDSNVKSTLPELVSLLPGSEISVPQGDKIWIYRINKSSPSEGALTYYEYSVSLSYSPNIKETQSSLSGLPNAGLTSLDLNSQEVKFTSASPFLTCLIENYLPWKVIAVWEAIKGILGIILGFAITIPSLLKAIIESIFSSDSQFSKPANFIMSNLTDKNTADALKDSDVTENRTLDILSYKTSSTTKDFVDGLISSTGIDVVIQTQSKTSGVTKIQKITDEKSPAYSTYFTDSITVSDFALRYKSLLALYAKYSQVGSLNGELVSVSILKNGKAETTTVSLNASGINSVRFSSVEFRDGNDIITFLRDNLYVAKELLKAQ